MNLVYLGAGLLALWFAFYFYDFDILSAFLGLVIGAVVGAFVCFLLALFLGSFAPTENVKTQTLDIVSIHTSDSIHGSFFLGSGTINGQTYYSYYAKTSDAGFQHGKVNADYTVVYEDMTEQKGRIEVYERRVDASWWLRNWVLVEPHYTYRAHIPKGSILQNFELK